MTGTWETPGRAWQFPGASLGYQPRPGGQPVAGAPRVFCAGQIHHVAEAAVSQAQNWYMPGHLASGTMSGGKGVRGARCELALRNVVVVAAGVSRVEVSVRASPRVAEGVLARGILSPEPEGSGAAGGRTELGGATFGLEPGVAAGADGGGHRSTRPRRATGISHVGTMRDIIVASIGLTSAGCRRGGRRPVGLWPLLLDKSRV